MTSLITLRHRSGIFYQEASREHRINYKEKSDYELRGSG